MKKRSREFEREKGGEWEGLEGRRRREKYYNLRNKRQQKIVMRYKIDLNQFKMNTKKQVTVKQPQKTKLTGFGKSLMEVT